MASSQALHNSSSLVHIISLLLPLLAFAFMVTTEAAPRHHASLRAQAAALLRWKSTMRGNSTALSSWNSDIPPCNWTGITCGDLSHAPRTFVITRISLRGVGIVGRLDTLDLPSLPYITSLDLSSNTVSGPIPPTIGSLQALSILNLSSCHLEGSIPSTVSNLTMLRGMYLYNNLLSGPIPEELGILPLLVHLDISSNKLTGTIPPNIANLTSLSYLVLSYNNLTGSIPKEIGRLEQLVSFDVSHKSPYGVHPFHYCKHDWLANSDATSE